MKYLNLVFLLLLVCCVAVSGCRDKAKEDKLAADLEAARTELAAAGAELALFKVAGEDFEKEVGSLTKNLQAAEAKVAGLNKQVTDLKKERDDAAAQAKDAEKAEERVTALTLEAQTLRRTAEQLRAANVELKRLVADLKKELEAPAPAPGG